jgi:hypothetical protein
MVDHKANVWGKCRTLRTLMASFMTFYAHMEPHPFTKGKVWANEISLTPSLFIEVHVPSQESEQTCIFVLVISMLSLSTGLIA